MYVVSELSESLISLYPHLLIKQVLLPLFQASRQIKGVVKLRQVIVGVGFILPRNI